MTGLLALVRGYFKRLALERELMRLDDRQLADIGILRCEISAVVRGERAEARAA